MNRVRPLKLTVDICPASESPLHSSGHVVAQLLCPVQRSQTLGSSYRRLLSTNPDSERKWIFLSAIFGPVGAQ